MPLTVKQVQHAKPGRHSDGRGLYLLVKPSGARSWVLRVQRDKKRQDYGIGSVSLVPIASDLPIERRSTLTLEDAREKARIGRELAKAGIDPSKHWRGKVDAPLVVTFAQAATRRHKEVATGWKNAKHRAQWLRTLEEYAFPTIGALPLDEVDAPTMQKALLPIWLAKPETARRVKQRMGAVLDYAQAQGWRKAEAPMRALNQLLGGIKQPKGGNFAAMPYADAPAFVARLRAANWSMGRIALQFLILTAARSGEVRGATWSEFDLETAEWRIPGNRMKAGKPHVVPLVPAAIDLLQALQRLFPHSPTDHVFVGNKGKAISDATMAKAMRETDGGDGFTPHGFRSTFRDWCADNGFANDWAEAALAHSVAGQEGKTVAAYKRTTFFDQRRDRLMPAWAAFVTGDRSKIVLLDRRHA